MIQKGIVEDIISYYEYKVRIPRYDKLSTTPGGVKTEDLSSAVVCVSPGTKIAFSKGDIVLVGFENEELNKPVILGLLYTENSTDPEQFNLPTIQSTLDNLEKNIEILNKNNLYAHIKYSNDNGLTFTSLYEYTDVLDFSAEQNTYIGANDIVIDSKSSTIYWSVIDSNSMDVSSEINIYTTLVGYFGEEQITETFTRTLIEVPIKFKGADRLLLSFKILKTLNFDDYHFVLTTDKNTLGSVYGDYMGICVSNSSIPSLDPASYSWTSFYDSIYYLVSKLENELLPRIERNEKALYGFTYSNDINESDGTGLLDAIRVENNTVHIHGSNNKNVSFSIDNSMYIDNENNSFILKETDFTDSASDTLFSDAYNDKGHLVLSVRRR